MFHTLWLSGSPKGGRKNPLLKGRVSQLMSAQQGTSRENITVTFCGVSIPAEVSLEFSEHGTLVCQARIVAEELLVKTNSVQATRHALQHQICGRLAPTRNILILDISQCHEEEPEGDSRPT